MQVAALKAKERGKEEEEKELADYQKQIEGLNKRCAAAVPAATQPPCHHHAIVQRPPPHHATAVTRGGRPLPHSAERAQ